jgi:pimeloyl-ACP methyl ester carboxylesterase
MNKKKFIISIFTILIVVVLMIGIVSAAATVLGDRSCSSTVVRKSTSSSDKINITIPMKIPASKIGLPTTGATIKSVTLVSALEKNNRNGEYYKVLGAIHPVDKTAPDINFQVNLPTKWNHKIVHYGGGGFNGRLVTAEGPYNGQIVTDPTPLAQGYATFGSDGGHVGTNWDSKFALNDEALHNFAVDQLKKTKDTAMVIVQSFYNSKPSQVYFAGASNGGREALMAVQRFPKDYDGVICLYPVLNWVPKALADNRNANVIQANNGAGWISPEEYKLVSKTVKNICDGLDGVEDGIVSNIVATEKKKERILKALKLDFSQEQLRTLKTFASSMRFSFPLANGLTTMPGYKVFQGALLVDRFRNQYGTSPTARDGVMAQCGDVIIKYQIMRDKDFNPVNFNPEQWKEKIIKASELLDATNPDISFFKEKGGKLLLLHGTADQLVTIQGSIDYYNQLVKKFGQSQLDKFVKFYLVPGYGHGVGEIFAMGTDLLEALDNWVVNKKVPSNMVVTDQNDGTAGRTRPLCEYPTYPRYKGNGNVNLAESFISVTP